METKTDLIKLIVFAILAGIAFWLLMVNPANGLENQPVRDTQPHSDWRGRSHARVNRVLDAYVDVVTGGDYHRNLEVMVTAHRAELEDRINAPDNQEAILVNTIIQTTMVAASNYYVYGFTAHGNANIEMGYRAINELTINYNWNL